MANVNLSSLDIVLKVRQPTDNEIAGIKENSTLISFLYPTQNKDLIDKLAQKKLTAFGRNSLEAILIKK